MSDVIPRLNAALAGRYRIERSLGEGGMATVYLADDVRHERKVALKVLKPELAALVGADRFLAEIKTTASLQHPHILPLHDSGEADGLLFYVMPYVQGESLRERLDRERQLPVDDAVGIAKHMAEALDYAHRRGVIHRDIKPANVLLLEGKPLISDFGIALAVNAGGGGRLTETGLSLGTPHYMSPEQATGDQHVGPATDIYALGCVLYEMLLGEPPFTGSTAQAVLGKVVAGQLIAPASQRPTIPNHVDAVIRKALEKVPADRFGSAESLGQALTEPAYSYGGEAATVSSPALRRRPRPREIVSWTLAAIFAAALILSLSRPRPPTPNVYDVGLPPEAPMAFTGAAPDGGGEPAFSLSPAGDFVVYTAAQEGTTALWYRSLVDAQARAIGGTSGAYYPMVSPDGESVAFIREGQLWRVDIGGGAASPLLDGAFSQAHWVTTDAILAGGSLVDPVTRQVTRLPSPCGQDPFVLESGLIVCSTQGKLAALHPDSSDVTFLRSRSGTAVPGSSPHPVGARYLSFLTSDGHLQVAPFDVDALEVGRPADVLQGLRREADGGVAHYGVTRDGALVYAPGENAEVGRLVRRRRDGGSEHLPVEPAAFLTVDVAHDGERLAAVVAGLEHHELRIFQLAQGRTSVWLSAPELREPRWSPSGARLAVGARFDSDGDWVVLIGDPRSGAPPDTIAGSGRPSQFLSEDTVLVQGPVAIVDFGRKPAVVHDLPQFEGSWPTLSPGRRWMAFNRSGVLIASYPDGLTRYAATAGGTGQEPVWRSSSELTYRLGHAFYTVSVPDRHDEPPAAPALWFDDERFVDTSGRSHAPTPDGGLVYLQTTAASSSSYLRVIPGWADEARRAADAANR